MSSAMMKRTLGLPLFASFTPLAITNSFRHAFCAPTASAERPDFEHHAEDREDADQQENDRRDEGEGNREAALPMHKAITHHRGPLLAEVERELQVIDVAAAQHDDAELNQRNAEIGP